MSDVMEEQRKRFDADRAEQLAKSRPYAPGPFAPGSFSVGQRDTHHFDIYAERRPGYVQWYYRQNPTSIAYPMADGVQERAFAIRGEPGDIRVRDERWDQESEMRDRTSLRFPSVESAMAWISATLLIDHSEAHP